MKLTSLQQQKVDEIVSSYDSESSVKVEFQAPTGSGKTIMATNVISDLIVNNPNDKLLFIIATLSSSELPRAFKNKIEQYKKGLNFSRFDVEYIESPSNNKSDKTESTVRVLPEQNKVYIFGKSTFGRNRIFTERNIVEDFMETALDQGYKVVYIRDEAHVGLDERGTSPTAAIRRNFEKLMSDSASFILEMTATPDFKSNSKKVILTESELNNPNLNDNKWLIKSNPKSLLNENILDTKLLEDGLLNFKKVQSEYKQLEKEKIYIRPALLIQVDNEPTDPTKKERFFDQIENIKNQLNHHGFSWVKYFGNEDKESNRVYGSNFNLNDITNNYSDIDVVIFKVGPSTGWDIPRACMLLQLRNVSSIKLNTQTIGRIKRNPYPNLEKNEITDKYYVYSNVEPEKSINVFRYKVKERFNYDEFAIVRITNEKEIKDKINKVNANEDIKQYLIENKNKIISNIKTFFIKNDGKKVFRDIRFRSGSKNIYTEISNVFLLLKEINYLINNNLELYNKISEVSKLFYKEHLFSEKLYIDEDENIKLQHLIFILLKLYKKELYEIINKKSNITPKYEVYLAPYDPRDYVQIISGDVINQENTDYLDNYLFDINMNDKNTSIQPLDSDPEEISFSKLRGSVSRVGSKVTIWSRNLTSSNLNVDFLDPYNKVKKSYFDYVIKFENGAFLYIESKSANDIDREKTQELKKAYASYFSNKVNSLFDIPIVISLWEVNKENNVITPENFYDKKFFSENLDGLNIRDLIEYISNVKF